MQFHLNGYNPGDPAIQEPADGYGEARGDGPFDEVDVLIVGCGPTGLTLAAQLSIFPEIRTRIIEQKPGRLLRGQADGIAVRTMEVFEAFGFSERVLKEAYWVNETAFWRPDDRHPETIVRNSRIRDTEDGLSEFPHVILNQARIHDFLLEAMWNSPTRLEPDYNRSLIGLTIDADKEFPVTATIRIGPPEEARVETVRTRYLVGCDGAHSTVRKSIGQTMRGDSANQAWGVMDVLAVTDFPDIRLKTFVQSSSAGSLLIIPREGGYMVRVYIELDQLDEGERVRNRNIEVGHIIEAVQRVLHPYTFDVKELVWWSVYEIGQRLCDRFDNVPEDETETRDPHVFIAGDACHTHSPKAGLGMNVSIRDAFNLGWKLASVLRGQTSPVLLRTYSSERRAVANELIEFDRIWAKMMSTPPKSAEEPDGVDPEDFQRYFARQLTYTAGTTVRYGQSHLIGSPAHQGLATGLPVGMRFHSAPAIRLSDAKPVELGHVIKADGRWRLIVFADSADPSSPESASRRLCDFLANGATSPLQQFTPTDKEIDSVIDVRAVFQQDHRTIAIESMPQLLLPRKGRYGLVDYQKMFCADRTAGRDVFVLRQIDREKGCVVIVRPDQHVSHVLPLDAYGDITELFHDVFEPASVR